MFFIYLFIFTLILVALYPFLLSYDMETKQIKPKGPFKDQKLDFFSASVKWFSMLLLV